MKQITLIGNLGQDAQTVNTENGEIIIFSVAVNSKNQNVEQTDWFSCSMKQTKVLEYLKKGTKVYIQGDLNIKADKEITEKKYLNIAVSKLVLIDSKKD